MMEPSFEKLLVRLTDHNVEFLLVGGLAVALNGYVRLTEDVDLMLKADPENIARLIHCLAEFGEGFGGTLTLEDFNDDPGAIRVVEETEACQIDLFTKMLDLRFENLLEDAGVTVIDGRTVRFASKGALIRLKEGSVREKDKIDVMALRAMTES